MELNSDMDFQSSMHMYKLSASDKEDISLNYMTNDQLPFVEITKPSTFVESKDNTMSFLNKQREKKFISDVKNDDFERIYSLSESSVIFNPISAFIESSERMNDFKLTGELQNWINTETFKELENQLKVLPYKENLLLQRDLRLLKNYAIGLAFKITEEKKKIRRVSEKDLKKFLRYFIKNLQDYHEELIEKTFNQDEYENDKLPQKYKIKFNIKKEKAVLFTQPALPKQYEDQITNKDIREINELLPENYQMADMKRSAMKKMVKETNLELGKVFQSAIDNLETLREEPNYCKIRIPNNNQAKKGYANTTRIIINPNRRAIPIVRPRLPRDNSFSQEGKDFNKYWTICDPLQSRRRSVSALDDLKGYTRDFTFEDIPEIGSDDSKSSSNLTPDSSEELLMTQISSDIKFSNSCLCDIEEDPKYSKEDDLRLLNEYTTNEMHEGGKSDNLFQRLTNIWQQLGFQAIDKFKLVEKYSKSSDEASKLSLALQYWEIALDRYKQYNKYYKDYKGFLQMETTKRSIPIYENDFQKAEDGIIDIAKHLKSNFGDALIIGGKFYQELINERHLKLKAILEIKDIKLPDFLKKSD